MIAMLREDLESGGTMDWKRILSPSFFAVVVLLFFMPFVLVSCSGDVVAEVSGMDFVTGTTISTGMGSQQVEAQPVAQAALVVAIAGAAMAFVAAKWRHIVSAIAGVTGFLLVQTLGSAAVQQVQSQGMGVSARTGTGLSGALLFYALATLSSGYLAWDAYARRHQTVGALLVEPILSVGGGFCEQCGSPAPPDGRFCEQCGLPLRA